MEPENKLIVTCPRCDGKHKIDIIMPPASGILILVCPKVNALFMVKIGSLGFTSTKKTKDYWNTPGLGGAEATEPIIYPREV